MKDWCKIFNHEEHGQIVVLNTTNDDNDPAVNVSWNPNWEHTGMLSVNNIFKNENECDDAFEKVGEAEIFEQVEMTVSELRLAFDKSNHKPPKLKLV